MRKKKVVGVFEGLIKKAPESALQVKTNTSSYFQGTQLLFPKPDPDHLNNLPMIF